ncbi:restriction system protein [Friedmanniella endophytica]|uniref:Restriction system protein n=1 Tax=Microlunatus kandeliicorticis TaxID=1759536 RepID=A0A7W3P4E8_9ACTN|nr:restriction endonuclease [Microlunatus kandeliicorticis]MBA8792808.1 restriction system protein [Microlunatus kandeliicorticis]
MPAAWVVRSGKNGEREAWSLQNGVAGTGWWEFPDLTPIGSRQELTELVLHRLTGLKSGAVAGYVGQLWALSKRIQVGDLMVLPLKTTKQIALGRVTGHYEYRANETDLSLRHVIPVDWIRTDVARNAVKQDLLFTLGSALTVFAPTKNHAIARLEAVLATGQDPGQVPSIGGSLSNISSAGASETDGTVDEPELSPDIEDVAQVKITARIAEEFAGHDLATLVTALLSIDGFDCRQSPPGPDGGVDILAGRGLLGLDEPLLLVQVKSGSQVGAPVVQQLHGAMAQFGASQGLLVSWGGVTKPAAAQLHNQKLRVRLWEAPDVVEAVLSRYDQLPEDIRVKLPLKRVWTLSGE